MYWVIAVFHLVIMPVAAFHALICKRDHRAALGWIGVIILFPVAGPILYLVFGINRLRTRAKVFTGHHLPVLHLGYERATRQRVIEHDPLARQLNLPPLAVVGGRATGIALTGGNQIRPLHNGEQFFPRLVEVIDSAQSYVLLSSYLFSPKGAANDVVAALGRAVDRGIMVKVMVDGLGAWYSMRTALRPLKKQGVDVRLFREPSLLPPSLDINLRNHRKIAVVDGHFGFFGGINIDPRHMVEDPDNTNVTQDVQFEAQGPLVADLHRLFALDWQLITDESLAPPPSTEPHGNGACRLIDSGPGDTLNQLSMTLLGVFAAATKSITIMMPYFLPSHEMTAALQTAVLRGVKVRILLPRESNLRFVDWATRNMLWELLVWDIEVYYKPKPFAHTKLIVVDDYYVLAGSANLDSRSLRLNFELGVEIFDRDLASNIQAHIDSGVAHSLPVTLSELDDRHFFERARDAFFWLFSSYL